MYCTNCGKEIFDEADICTNCGCKTENYKETLDIAVSPSKTSFIQKVLDNVRSEPKKMFIMRLSATILFLITALYNLYSLYEFLDLYGFMRYGDGWEYLIKNISIYVVRIFISALSVFLLNIKQNKVVLLLVSFYFCIYSIYSGYVLVNNLKYFAEINYFDKDLNLEISRTYWVSPTLQIVVLLSLAVIIVLIKQNIIKKKVIPFAVLLGYIIIFQCYLFSQSGELISLSWLFIYEPLVASCLACHYYISANKYKKEAAENEISQQAPIIIQE
ncbi:MAG: zinc ribbon domain-containing protein [Eubacterium sp.]|nr:zinc ribbon domain-containing protein [Eubacterium sp.]